jgi:hypothetical protein
MRFTFLALLICSSFIAGCGQAPAPATIKADPAAPDPSIMVKEGIDIGDVEHGVRLEVTLPEDARPPQVQVEEMRDLKKDLNMVIVTLKDPALAALPVQVKIFAGADTSTQPVVLRGRVMRDNAAIASFHTILSPAADRVVLLDGQPFPDLTFNCDTLKAMEPRPASYLIHVEADAFLMPAGTDPATLDAATATAVPTSTTTLLSNPVRVNLATPGNPA